MILTAGQLIDALGGNRDVAAMIGVRHNTVSTWRERGFPAWVAAKLQDAAERAQVRYDPSLFEIRPRAKSAA